MDYQVAVKTPLGRFNTVVEITYTEDDFLSGSFEIMGLSSSFKGKKLADDKIEFTGAINTPIGEIEYSSTATVHDQNFEGIAKTKVGDFEFMPIIRRKRK